MKAIFTFLFIFTAFEFNFSQQVTDVSPDGKFTNTYTITPGRGENLNYQDVPYGTAPSWNAKRDRQIGGLAFGDYDGDGDLDLAVGCYYSQSYPPINDYENFIFRNNNGVLDTLPAWISSDERTNNDILWVDINMDGRPDLLSANGQFQHSVLYLNSDSGLSTTPAWISNDNVWTVGAAVCDVDGDGDLDVAFANQGLDPIPHKPIQIFLNNNGMLSTTPAWSSADIMITNSVAFADINNSSLTQQSVTYFANGTGYNFLIPMNPVYTIDAVLVNGVEIFNYTIDQLNSWLALGYKPSAGSQVDITYTYISYGDMAAAKWVYFESGVYFNNNGVMNTSPGWTVGNTETQKGAGWADIDLDGYMDLAIGGNGMPTYIYKNNNGVLSTTPYWASNSPTSPGVQDLIWGDVNRDGYSDLAVVHFGTRRTEIYINRGGNLDTTPTWTYAASTSSTSIAFGDVNGDGWLDLAIGTARQPVMLFIADSSLIPVELTSFTASLTGKDILIDWKTSTENNNKGFELERKIDNGSSTTGWNRIAFIPGKGTSTELNSYSFKDATLNNGKYFYRLKQIDYDGSYTYSHIAELEVILSLQFNLEQNYPNPFNPETKIKYQIPKLGGNEKLFVSLKVFDVLGREVAILVNEEQNTGEYEVSFRTDGRNISSGAYFYTLTAGDMVITKKLMLSK